jgi:tRNA G37 N-methylase Trm5
LQPFLAKPSNYPMLSNVHPRIKLVQDYNETYKQLLLISPSTPLPLLLATEDPTGIPGGEEDDHDIHSSMILPQHGPSISIPLSYRQLSYSYILQQLLPPHLLPPPTSYEQIGHIAHFNLKDTYQEYQELIGQVLLETTAGINTVVQKVGHVSGKYRTYNYQVLAATHHKTLPEKNHHKDHHYNHERPSSSNSSSLLETTVIEDGVKIHLNVAECYWSTRLSGERQEIIKEILQSTTTTLSCRRQRQQQQQPLVIVDAFCGVGAVCLLLAKKQQLQQQQQQQGEMSTQKQSSSVEPKPLVVPPSIQIIANDWNPKAMEYFQRNIEENNLDRSQFQLSCLDGYDFLMDLGGATTGSDVEEDVDMMKEKHDERTDKRRSHDQKKGIDDRKKKHGRLPDHVLMNFPLEAPKFLGALRWWSWKKVEKQQQQQQHNNSRSGYPRFHVYTFARATAVGAGNEEDVAVDIVANELLPDLAPIKRGNYKIDGEDIGENRISHRRRELNNEFDANVSTRLVRDVAPGKVVVCVSFSLTPKLIRYMQGEYF